MIRRTKIKPQKRPKRGRPPSSEFEVNVVSKSRRPSALGYELVVECIDRSRTRTLWEVLTDDEGRIVATIRNREQDVLTKHCKAVRKNVKRLAGAAARQTEMFDPTRSDGGKTDGT